MTHVIFGAAAFLLAWTAFFRNQLRERRTFAAAAGLSAIAVTMAAIHDSEYSIYLGGLAVMLAVVLILVRVVLKVDVGDLGVILLTPPVVLLSVGAWHQAGFAEAILILLNFLLTGFLVARLIRPASPLARIWLPAVWGSAICGIIAFAAVGSFDAPGDAGIGAGLLWLFIFVPAFGLSCLAVLSCALIVFLVERARRRRGHPFTAGQ